MNEKVDEKTVPLIIEVEKGGTKVDVLLALVEEPKATINNGKDEVDNPLFGRNINDIFPLEIKNTDCGCIELYKTLADFPDDTVICEHGNVFVLFKNR